MSSLIVRLSNRCPSLLLAVGICVGLPNVAAAQQAPLPQVAVPVVQSVPQKSAGMRLNDALYRLARNPQDIAALTEAGQASLELGDAQASIGFYRRALTIQPNNARIKAGLAGAYVLGEDPFTAIELFDEAEKDGPIEPARLADRGLAFDLVGDNQTAQHFYRQSLAGVPSDETLRRLALSQAISRDRRGMDTTLAPLLQKQDKAAWRTRAFGLAILGQPDEAEAIARQTMPMDMATAITAYLRYMVRLTASQQAAAGNLGRFPRASEIGNDDPRVAYFSRSRVQVAAAAPAAQLALAGKGKGKGKARDEQGKPGGKTVPAKPVRVVQPPPEPIVGRETSAAIPQLAQATSPAPRPVPPPASAVVPAQVTAPTPVAVPAPRVVAAAPVTISAQPGFAVLEQSGASKPATFDLARPTPAAATPLPNVAPKPSPARPKPSSIDEAFADLAPPSREIEPQNGAVDVRRIKPKAPPTKEPLVAEKAKDAKDPKAKPAAPSYPSRIWVQLATGRDKSALGFDWRKLTKDDPLAFKGQKPSITAWGQSNRLLAGPFPSAKEANAFLAQLKKSGVAGAFVWTSPAGQVVDPLTSGK